MRRVRIELDGTVAIAVLHEDGAPRTAARLWDALPIEGTLRHVRWSGEAGYIMSPALAGENGEPERPVSFYPPGGIVLRSEHGELAFAYGQSQARDNLRIADRGCHVASIETNGAEFLERVAATGRGGGRPIRLAREVEG